MNINKLKLSLLVLAGVVLFPSPSLAASNAILLNDTNALFTIDFTVSDTIGDIDIPVLGTYGATYQDRIDTVGYTIRSMEGSAPAVTAVNALVLSASPLKGVRYHVPKGTEATFTLFILATFTNPITETELKASISKLPYFRDSIRTTMHQNQLDELPAPRLKVESK
jgi:hypothetical protein